MSKNLLFVTTTNNLTILVDEAKLMEGNFNVIINLQGRNYETKDWTCINKVGVRRLHETYRKEYFEVAESLVDILQTMKEEREKKLENQKEIVEVVKEVEVIKEVPQQNGGLGGTLEKLMIETLANATVKEMAESIRPQLDEYIQETYGVLPQVIEIRKDGQKQHEIHGAVHEEFETVLKLVEADVPVFLTGPAGSGKNHLCKMVADSLGLDFYFTNAVTSEYKITGFIDANGNFHETEFYKAFKNGGLFMLDEMDASIPEVLIILNAAIANRYFDFPTGKITAHENFRVISAGNTVGTGADSEYTGRIQLDGASLDRFALIEIDYSYDVEMSIANGDKELVTFIRDFREALKDCGIQHLVSYRAIDRITKMNGVLELKRVMDICLFKHLNVDDLRILSKCMKHTNNQYYKTMTEHIEMKKVG